MPHIDTSKSISMLRCPTSTCPNRFRCFDVAHRHVQIDFDASMPHIDMSKSIWMLRCHTSTYPNRFRCFDVPHRYVQIDFDASMPHIDMSKSISMLRSASSKHRQVGFSRPRCCPKEWDGWQLPS